MRSHFGGMLRYSTTLSDQTRVDLIQNGRSIPVKFSDRMKFAELAAQARLNECNVQIQAIRRLTILYILYVFFLGLSSLCC